MARYVISDEAPDDLAEIWAYIAADSEDAASRTIDVIYERFQLLAENPLIGQSRSELLPDLRSFVAGSYVIFYRPTDHGINILRLIHGARDIGPLF